VSAEATRSAGNVRDDEPSRPRDVIAFVHPKPLGAGGLGRLAEDALRSLLASGAEVHAFGPSTPAAVRETLQGAVWHEAPPGLPDWVGRWTWLRWWLGQRILLDSRRLGRWAAREVALLRPDRCYLFAEVALETLEWTRAHAIPSVLDNPTGDVRHFRDAWLRETRRWVGGTFRGHPSEGMVARSAREYALADAVRVASTFSRDSMVERGVAAGKVAVVRYPIDVRRFVPPSAPRDGTGRLRVCCVASIGLAKGFQYLLEAARATGPDRVELELVGGTDSRGARLLLARLRDGMTVRQGSVPQLLEAYQRAELFVLPSLHDGWGFVVPEAMACGLPVVVTDTSGARDLVEPGRTGWIVPAGDAAAIAEVLREALADRGRLARMGAAAREAVATRAREWDGELGR
jgi:glycosyltransferase involved in cell wall biosynthesis